jgi:ribonuclease P protein component
MARVLSNAVAPKGVKSSPYLTSADTSKPGPSSESNSGDDVFNPSRAPSQSSDGLRFTFRKKERLKSQKVIQQLFAEGNSYSSRPLLVRWLCSTKPIAAHNVFPVRFAVTASKRNFSKAPDRNRIKRLIREVWRMNKGAFYATLPDPDLRVEIMMIYTGKKIPEIRDIQQSMDVILAHLQKSIHTAHSDGK